MKKKTRWIQMIVMFVILKVVTKGRKKFVKCFQCGESYHDNCYQDKVSNFKVCQQRTSVTITNIIIKRVSVDYSSIIISSFNKCSNSTFFLNCFVGLENCNAQLNMVSLMDLLSVLQIIWVLQCISFRQFHIKAWICCTYLWLFYFAI